MESLMLKDQWSYIYICIYIHNHYNIICIYISYLDLQTDNVFNHVGKQQKQNRHIFRILRSHIITIVHELYTVNDDDKKTIFNKISQNTTNITIKLLTTILNSPRLVLPSGWSARWSLTIGLWNPPWMGIEDHFHGKTMDTSQFGECFIEMWVIPGLCLQRNPKTIPRLKLGTWDASNGKERATKTIRSWRWRTDERMDKGWIKDG